MAPGPAAAPTGNSDVTKLQKDHQELHEKHLKICKANEANIQKLKEHEKKYNELEKESHKLKEKEQKCNCKEQEKDIAQLKEQEKKCLVYRTCNEQRWRDIQLLIKKPQELDICFLIDATSSMRDTIAEVINRINMITSGIVDAYPECDLTLSLVIYRDRDCHERRVSMACPFTSDFRGGGSLFMETLNAVDTVGGEDSAEDVLLGLQEVAKLNWRATENRLLVHIGDAPCHGRQFHDLRKGEDTCPEVDDDDVCQVLDQLRIECRVTRYIFLHVNDSTKKMISKFRELVCKSRHSNIPMAPPMTKSPKGFNSISITSSKSWIVDDDRLEVYVRESCVNWHLWVVERCTEIITESIDCFLFLSYILCIAKSPLPNPPCPPPACPRRPDLPAFPAPHGHPCHVLECHPKLNPPGNLAIDHDHCGPQLQKDVPVRSVLGMPVTPVSL